MPYRIKLGFYTHSLRCPTGRFSLTGSEFLELIPKQFFILLMGHPI